MGRILACILSLLAYYGLIWQPQVLLGATYWERYLVLWVFLILLWKDRLLEDFRSFYFDKNSWKIWLELVIWGLGIFFFTQTVSYLLLGGGLSQISTQNSQSLIQFARANGWRSLALLMVVGAPFLEEVIFRQAMLGWLPKKIGLVYWLPFLLVSLVTFTAIHVREMGDWCYYLPVATGLTLAYWRFGGNLIASIVLHSLVNVVSWYLLWIGYLG